MDAFYQGVLAASGTLGHRLMSPIVQRGASLARLVVGMAMCALGGIGQVGASGKWASPLAIVGYLLGSGILVVIISVFTGWKLPLIQGETQAVAVVGGLMLVKYLIGTASLFLHLL